MHRPPSPTLLRLAVAATAASALLWLSPTAGAAAGSADAAGATPVEACEQAARQSLAGPKAPPVEVTFAAVPTVQTHLSTESQLVLRGTGRWRSGGTARSFTYNCNVDPRTADVVGLAMRDSTPVAAPVAVARAPAEPDLSRLSPAACESSAVLALKRRWPLVSQISFESGTRSFGQRSASRADLRGSGRAQPVPGAPSTFFGFDCEIDPRDGQVLRTNVS